MNTLISCVHLGRVAFVALICMCMVPPVLGVQIALTMRNRRAEYQSMKGTMTQSKLRRYHAFAFVVQTATSIVIGVLASTDSKTMAIPIYTLYPTTNSTTRLTDAWVPAPSIVGHFNGGYSSSAFLAMSAFNHMLFAVFPCCLKMAVHRLASPVRWLEYSVSASLMHVQIATLCGILDVHLLFSIAALTATTMLFGLLQERQEKRTLGLFKTGFAPWLMQWIVIMSYFFRGVSQASAPWWVWLIIFIELALDSLFAVVMHAQERELVHSVESSAHDAAADTARAEVFMRSDLRFIVLSLTAKQLLAWLNYYGAHA